MENELSLDEAMQQGFTLTRDAFLNGSGWSTATLHRKMKTMTAGVDFVFVPGKTKPTPHFQVAALWFAGVETPTAEPEQITALEKLENKNVSRKSQNNFKKVSTDTLSKEFTNALILPHKLWLTLHEAKALTGFPLTALHKHSEIKHGRRVIKKSRLEKI